MKKKLLSFIVCIAMILTMLPVTAFAADGAASSITVSVPEGRTISSVQEGDEITVELSNADFVSDVMLFRVYFDSTLFRLDSIEGTNPKNTSAIRLFCEDDEGFVTSSAKSTVDNANSNGYFGVQWGRDDDYNYRAGVIATLRFTAIGIGSGDFSLYEDRHVLNGDSYKGTVSTTSVTVLKTPMAAASATVDAPTKGNAFPTAVTIPENAAYSASVAWFTDADCTTSAGNIALGGQTYYAQITLTPDKNNGESFASSVAVTGSATGDYTPTSGNLVLTVPFTTPQRMITDLAVTTATQSYYVGEGFDTATLVVKAIYDDGTTDDDYKAYTVQDGENLAYGTYPVKIFSNDDSKVATTTDITVSKRDLPTSRISITPTELTYNDNDQKDSITVVINGIAPELTGALTVIYKISDKVVETIKDVGTYDVYVSTNGSNMYNPLEETKVGTVAINKANATLTAPTAKVLTYNGTAQALVNEGQAQGGELQYKLGADGAYSTSVATATDAGTYTVYYRVVGDKNHKDVTEDSISVTIDKAPITPTVSIEGWTYGETAKTPSVNGNSGNGTVTYSYAAKGNDDFKTATPTDAGEYTVKATIAETANYLAGEATADFTIAKADASVTAPATKTDLTYNGQAQALIDAGSTTGGTMQYKLGADGTYSTVIPTATDAGTYTVYYKVVGNDNYNGVDESSVTVTIKKQPVDVSQLTWQTADSFDYDAQAKTVTLSSAIPQGLTANYENNTATYVGEYTATVSFTADDNHEVSGTPATFSWKINPVANPITITKDSYNLAKGGNTLDLATLIQDAKGTVTFSVKSGEAAELNGSVLTSGDDSSETPVVIGIHIDGVNEGGDSAAEYNVYDNASAITVTVVDKEQKTLTVTMGDWTYGDNARSPAFTAPAGSAAPAITYTGKNYSSNEVPTDAGTYTVQVVCETATEIYTGSDEFTINPKTASITWSNTSFTYDGQNHVPTATVSNKVGQDSVSVTVSGAATAAGSYTATATGLDNANYVLPAVAPTRSFTIAKRTAELNWSNTSFTYDGQSHQPTATVTNAVDGDTVTVTVSGGKTNAGSYTATAAELSNSNYALPTAKTQSFTIVKRTAELNWTNTSFTYDGKSHVPTATVTNAVEGDTVTVTVTGGQTNAGNYTATATKVSNSNYALPDTTGCDFTIAPKNISDMTVNLSAAALTYNGKAQTKAVASVRDGSTTLSSGRDYTVSGATQTNAGHYELTVTGTGNYTGSKTVAWEIAPKTVTITANNASKVYGEADPTLTATVSGVVSGDTIVATASRADGNNVGSYTISAAVDTNSSQYIAGNYNINLVNATFTINPKAVTVTANDAEKTYGEKDPQLTATVTGLLGEDSITYDVTRKEGDNAGTYTITASGAATQGNYTITYVTGKFTINPLTGDEIVAGEGVSQMDESQSQTFTDGLAQVEQFTDEAVGIQEGDDDAVKQVKREEAIKKTMMAQSGFQSFAASALYYVSANNAAASQITLAVPNGAANSSSYNYKVMYMAADGTVTEVPSQVTANGIVADLTQGANGVYMVAYEAKPTPAQPSGGGAASSGQSIITDLKDITRVSVDGKTVDPKNYTVSGGVVTLSEAYLRTLSNGKHTVRVENAKYISTAVITVSNSTVKSAGTGDMGLGLYALLAISSVTGAAWLGLKKRKED